MRERLRRLNVRGQLLWDNGDSRTLDRLLSEEVVRHGLDGRRKARVFGVANDLGKILENQAPRRIRPLALELCKIVANIAADIHEKHIIRIDAIDQTADIVEVHPARASLMVGRHVIVELTRNLWILLEELEEMEIGAVTGLEWAVLAIRWNAVAIFLQERGKGERGVADAIRPRER